MRPEATASTIIPTVTRMPRIHGFPPMTIGSNVMRRSSYVLFIAARCWAISAPDFYKAPPAGHRAATPEHKSGSPLTLG